MNKSILIIFTLIILLGVGGFVYLNQSTNKSTPEVTSSTVTPAPSPEVKKEFSAEFVIYTNNTFRDFSNSRYHNLSPDVYIDPSNPNLVHVKKAGITWLNFFSTLPMKLKKDCLVTGTKQTFCSNDIYSLKFYINGKNTPNALDLEIKDGYKLLVSFGPISDMNVIKQNEALGVTTIPEMP